LGAARPIKKPETHAYEHAAANVPPGQGKYRLVFREAITHSSAQTIRHVDARRTENAGLYKRKFPRDITNS